MVIPHAGLDVDDESDCNSIDDCISSRGVTDDEAVDYEGAEAPVDNAHADALEAQLFTFVQQAAIIREEPENGLAADLSKSCGCLCGRLGQQGHF